jgi:adenylate cyclase
MLKAASEQEAVDGALADCANQDRSCRVVAIGPFAVEPK